MTRLLPNLVQLGVAPARENGEGAAAAAGRAPRSRMGREREEWIEWGVGIVGVVGSRVSGVGLYRGTGWAGLTGFGQLGRGPAEGGVPSPFDFVVCFSFPFLFSFILFYFTFSFFSFVKPIVSS